MKLFHKVFLCFVILLGIVFEVFGFLLADHAYRNAIEQEKKLAFQEFTHNKFILQSILYLNPGLLTKDKEEINGIQDSFTVPVALYGEDKECVLSTIKTQPELPHLNEEDDRIAFRICQEEDASYILVYDLVRQGEDMVYLVTETDISSAVEAQKSMSVYVQNICLITLCIGFPVIFLLTRGLTEPIKKISKAARRIAEGRYSERIGVDRKDEIGELAADFDLMAQKVEEKIAELSDAARSKEDFAANFAHELKTPLTSVIGYADMLYQRELPREQVKEAARYIWNEGMRLEALSVKLMDWFVLNKQDFVLQQMSVGELFDQLLPGIDALCRKSGTALHTEVEVGEIDVEYDLFCTMVTNLIDNAIKADCTDIEITGKECGAEYRIYIADNGKGIPPEELGRITEAFYMVDKSRARKQHGAGLGMALVSRISDIHGAKMQIESDGRSGTTICLTFPAAGGREA